MLRHGGVTEIMWDKCKPESSGLFSTGSWAGIDSIKTGKKKPWHSRPVLILVESFLEKDHDEESHWITLAQG